MLDLEYFSTIAIRCRNDNEQFVIFIIVKEVKC